MEEDEQHQETEPNVVRPRRRRRASVLFNWAGLGLLGLCKRVRPRLVQAIIFLFVHLRGAAGCCALGRAARLPRRTAYHWLRGRYAPSGAVRQGDWVFGGVSAKHHGSRRSRGCDQRAGRCWGRLMLAVAAAWGQRQSS
jgi:hypothetical protein